MARRKSRLSTSKPTAKKQKTSSTPSVFEQNPFWKIYGSDSNHISIGVDGQDEFQDAMVIDGEEGVSDNLVDRALDDMLKFMELSKRKNLGKDLAADDAGEPNTTQEQNQLLLVEETVQSLLARMDEFQQESLKKSAASSDRSSRAIGGNVFVSAEEIARLLVPWSVKGILSNAYKRKSLTTQSTSPSSELMYWKTLKRCLEYALGGAYDQKGSAGSRGSLNTLTLSTLHKLVPVALQCSLEENDNLQETACVCFCQLVDHLYRPPLDVICDVLLPILTTDSAGIPDSGASSTWTHATTSTLRLMKLRLASANPKKSFQLLVRREVFLNLATVHLYATSCERTNPGFQTELTELKDLFNDLIRSGIFSLENHMDGFRSLRIDIPIFDDQPKVLGKDGASKSSGAKSSFSGYQEALFDVLENILIPCNDDKDRSNDRRTVSTLIPLLVNLFFEQVSKMQKQQVTSKSHKKVKASDKLSHLQFRFFSCLSGYILKGLLSSKQTPGSQIDDSRLRLSLFATLGDNLDLLLRHNIYQPSLGNNAERSFLDKIGNEIIQLMINRAEDIKGKSRLDEWRKSLRILDVLVQLNHTILHDQLTEIIAKCLAFDWNEKSLPDSPEQVEESSTFLVTIIVTYGRLRQLDYFYHCLFGAVKELSRQNDFNRIQQHLAFANNARIAMQLGKTIQGSPIQQLRKIFSDVNDFIVNGSFVGDDKLSSEVSTIATTVVTKHLVGLLQNVRVDTNSFNDIYPICGEIMDGSVKSLTRYSGDMKNALVICAWTIHLKNRCEFWIDEKQIEPSGEDQFGVPRVLHEALNNAASSVSKISDPDVLEPLKFLACQRIQQLHGDCYEKQRLAYATDGEQYSTAKEKLEAKELVGFILQRCDTDGEARSVSETVDQWTVLAESIAIWAPHANENNIDSFLNLLLRSAATARDTNQRERNLLLGLLADSSFYEIPNVSCRLGMNVASFVAEIMQNIVDRCDGSTTIKCPTLQDGWKTLSIQSLTNSLQAISSLSCVSKNFPEICEQLEEILRVLDTINDVGISVWKDCKDGLKVFQSLMQTESICNQLEMNEERTFRETKVRLISALRSAISRVSTTIALDSDDGGFEPHKEHYSTLLTHLLENSSKAIHHELSSSTIRLYMNSWTTILESLVDMYIVQDSNATKTMIKAFKSVYDQAEVSQGGYEYLLLTNYAVILLKKFKSFGNGDKATTIELARAIRERIWNTAFEYCFNASKDADFLFQNQSIILVAEMLRLCSTGIDTQLVPLSSVEKRIVTRVRNLLTSDSDEYETRAISYLVGCFAMAKPSKIVRQELTFQLLLANLKQNDMFLTPLSILAKGMESDELDDFLSKLTSSNVDMIATTRKLKVVHMIVLSAKDETQIDALSNYSSLIMNNCLQVMTQVARQTDVRSDSVLEVSALIADMASKKDMMVLRERDIALILARITSTVSLGNELVDDQRTETQLKGFNATFSLVSLFLQRFSKQVHSCVPSLVISLTSMLQFALSSSLTTDSMSLCGQKFSRLCELLLPHGDVYKKHIICLILRFVNAMREDVHPVAKKSLLPGIYCLLDIIQDHESMQLNSMLDEECRAILRSIHEGYKKIHVYKGQ